MWQTILVRCCPSLLQRTVARLHQRLRGSSARRSTHCSARLDAPQKSLDSTDARASSRPWWPDPASTRCAPRVRTRRCACTWVPLDRMMLHQTSQSRGQHPEMRPQRTCALDWRLSIANSIRLRCYQSTFGPLPSSQKNLIETSTQKLSEVVWRFQVASTKCLCRSICAAAKQHPNRANGSA
jgi:hypothetical protein